MVNPIIQNDFENGTTLTFNASGNTSVTGVPTIIDNSAVIAYTDGSSHYLRSDVNISMQNAHLWMAGQDQVDGLRSPHLYAWSLYNALPEGLVSPNRSEVSFQLLFERWDDAGNSDNVELLGVSINASQDLLSWEALQTVVQLYHDEALTQPYNGFGPYEISGALAALGLSNWDNVRTVIVNNPSIGTYGGFTLFVNEIARKTFYYTNANGGMRTEGFGYAKAQADTSAHGLFTDGATTHPISHDMRYYDIAVDGTQVIDGVADYHLEAVSNTAPTGTYNSITQRV